MNRIEEQARYYRNIPLRDRSIKAVVHLEDAEDKLFWNNQLEEARCQIALRTYIKYVAKLKNPSVGNMLVATNYLIIY